MTGDEAGAYLHDQSQKHDEIKVMLAKIDLGSLPEEQVIALAEAVADMNDEAPVYDNMSVDDMRDVTEIL